jgi:cell division protein FtsL
MLPTINKLILNLTTQVADLEKELKETKQKLQYRHTEINDLRYKIRQMDKASENDLPKDELRNGTGVARRLRVSA